MSSSSEEVTHSESEVSDAGESGDDVDLRETRGSLDVVGHAATTTARASPPAFRVLESFSSGEKGSPARAKRRKTKTRRKKLDALGVCLVNCKYPLLHDVTSKLGYREVGEEEDWCLYWTDTSVAIERVMRLKPLQKINHFTGMLEICRKKASSGHGELPSLVSKRGVWIIFITREDIFNHHCSSLWVQFHARP